MADSLAASPVRWIIRRNQAVVTGVPASVTNHKTIAELGLQSEGVFD